MNKGLLISEVSWVKLHAKAVLGKKARLAVLIVLLIKLYIIRT